EIAPPDRVIASLTHDTHQLRLVFRDGSSIVVPRTWSGRITDLVFDGALAAALMRSHVSLAREARQARPPRQEPSALRHEQQCAELEEIAVNRVFYRDEPHQMRRYSALAFDNIRRDPLGFALASAYRAVRLFVV